MAAAGKAYLDLFSLQKFSIHHKFSAYKMYIKTLELIGKKNLMASYMYTGSSVKTAQVLAVSSVLVQALLTNRLTCRFPAQLSFPRKA